jgi:hypothetical protein
MNGSRFWPANSSWCNRLPESCVSSLPFMGLESADLSVSNRNRSLMNAICGIIKSNSIPTSKLRTRWVYILRLRNTEYTPANLFIGPITHSQALIFRSLCIWFYRGVRLRASASQFKGFAIPYPLWELCARIPYRSYILESPMGVIYWNPL